MDGKRRNVGVWAGVHRSRPAFRYCFASPPVRHPNQKHVCYSIGPIYELDTYAVASSSINGSIVYLDILGRSIDAVVRTANVLSYCQGALSREKAYLSCGDSPFLKLLSPDSLNSTYVRDYILDAVKVSSI